MVNVFVKENVMGKCFDIIIAGGGASGMMAAYQASMNGKSVLLIEKNDRLGKKILETGNGRCNLTNMNMSKECYGRETSEFAFSVILQFNELQVMDFFKANGLLLHNRNGYVYPNCDQASAVNDFFERQLSKDNITIEYSCEIISVHKDKVFEVKTSNGTYQGKKFIVAMGSKAHPKSGSDGKGYDVVKSLGHHLNPVLPSLTALESSYGYCKDVAGVRADSVVSCVIEDTDTRFEERGEVQLTDYGVSGIPVFQISRYAVQGIYSKKKVTVFIDFLPDYTEEDIIQFIDNKKKNVKQTAMQCISGLINSKITKLILKECGIKVDQDCSCLTDKKLKSIVHRMKRFEYPIKGYRSFDYGQVCQGGVKVTELDESTMESKVIPGLYIVGELVDVDGICGGYNLQWAFSSGYLAGKAAGQ